MTIAQCKDGRTALLSKGTIEIQVLVGAISTANITISYRDFYIGGRRRYFIALSFGKFQEFIKASIAVGDEEARGWYNDHQQELTTPERRCVRHLFIATLERESDEAKQILEVHLESIKAGKASIESLASSVSEDEGSKNTGGNLGWMLKDRLPGDFAAHAFTMPVSEPRLIRTKLGWHIIEVTEIKAPELLPYEMMKLEIITSLSDLGRKQAIDQYRHQLRLLNHEKVEIYRQLLD